MVYIIDQNQSRAKREGKRFFVLFLVVYMFYLPRWVLGKRLSIEGLPVLRVSVRRSPEALNRCAALVVFLAP